MADNGTDNSNSVASKIRTGMWFGPLNIIHSVISALLFYGGISALVGQTTAGNTSCGSLLRPILDRPDAEPVDPIGWIWNGDIRCPRTIGGLWWSAIIMLLLSVVFLFLAKRDYSKHKNY